MVAGEAYTKFPIYMRLNIFMCIDKNIVKK